MNKQDEFLKISKKVCDFYGWHLEDLRADVLKEFDGDLDKAIYYFRCTVHGGKLFHIPNNLTIKTFKDTDAGKGLEKVKSEDLLGIC